jgi:glycine oxidase
MLNQETFKEHSTTEAVVIGGGVIGLSVARALRLRGMQRVALVERGALGAEASHAAAGMLAPQVEADRPDAFFKLACRSRDLYPAFSDALREETGIDIELERTGTLLLAFNTEDERAARHRYDWQTRAGLSVEQLTGDEARAVEPSLSPAVQSALRFPNDWQVENRRLVRALASAAKRLGVRLLTGANAEALLIERGRVQGVETSHGRLASPVVVIAGGAWSSLITVVDKCAPAIRIEPVRGQILCFEANPRMTRHVVYSPRGYIVPRLDGRLLAGSTTERAGFDKRVTDDGRQRIMAQAVEIAPAVGQLPLLDSWAGLRPRAEDGLPVIGNSTEIEGLLYATAHYRNGILLAPLTAEIIAAQVAGGAKPEAQQSAFSPERFHLAGVN